MKKKTTLAFEQLENEMEILTISEVLATIGGVNPQDGDTWIIDGYTFVWDSSLQSWTGNLPSVTINSSAGSSFPTWTWSNYGLGTSGSFMLSSAGYIDLSDPGNTGGGGGSGGGTGGGGTGSDPYMGPMVTSGSNTSTWDIVTLMTTSLGIAADHAAIGASVANLERAVTNGFRIGSGVFVFINGASNVIDFLEDPNWEDATQVVGSAVLFFGVSNPLALIVGGTLLTAWELYEYRRDQ